MTDHLRVELDIELVSDVCISATNRTLGAAETLTSLPGRTLWGLAATLCYQAGMDEAEAFQLFHQGAVRFADAVPVHLGHRSYPTPRAWHVPKSAGAAAAARNLAVDAGEAEVQHKPLAAGWLTPDGSRIEVATSHALRTSVDRSGKPRDGLLYGLPTIQAGQNFWTCISGPADAVERVVAALTRDDLSLGRSRNTELGRVRFRRRSTPIGALADGDGPTGETLSFLCVTRCVLRDPATGAPTLQPFGAAFGLDAGWAYDPARSFVRTARVVHFHGKRGRPETERFALERGSVVTFRKAGGGADWAAVLAATRAGVGEHVGEGYGEVLAAPTWLSAATHPLRVASAEQTPVAPPTDALFAWARREADAQKASRNSFEAACALAPELARFKVPPAQWGAVHALARAARIRQASDEAFRAELQQYLGEGRRNVDAGWKGGARQQLLEALQRPDRSNIPQFVEYLAGACMRAGREGGSLA